MSQKKKVITTDLRYGRGRLDLFHPPNPAKTTGRKPPIENQNRLAVIIPEGSTYDTTQVISAIDTYIASVEEDLRNHPLAQ